MITGKVDGASVGLSIKGSLQDLMAESLLIIRNVYECIKEVDESCADEYKKCMTKSFKDGIVFFSEDEMDKLVKKATKDILDAIKSIKENEGIHVEGEDE